MSNLFTEDESEVSEIDPAEIAKLVQDTDDLDLALFGKSPSKSQPKSAQRKKSRVSFEDTSDIDELLLSDSDRKKNVDLKASFNHGDPPADSKQRSDKKQVLADLFGLTDLEKLNISNGTTNEQPADWLGLKSPKKSEVVAEKKHSERNQSVKLKNEDDFLSSMGLGETKTPQNSSISDYSSRPSLDVVSPKKATQVLDTVTFGNYAPTISREPARPSRRGTSQSGIIDPLGLFSDSHKPPRDQRLTKPDPVPVHHIAVNKPASAETVQSYLTPSRTDHSSQSKVDHPISVSSSRVDERSTSEQIVTPVSSNEMLALDRQVSPWMSGPSGEHLATNPEPQVVNISPLSALTQRERAMLAGMQYTPQPDVASLAQQVERLVAQQQLLSQQLALQGATRDQRNLLETEVNELRSALGQMRDEVVAKQQMNAEEQRLSSEAELSSRWEAQVRKLQAELHACAELHAMKVAWLQSEAAMREEQLRSKVTRLEEEVQETREAAKNKMSAAGDEMRALEERHRSRLAELQAEHAADLKQLREFHRQSLEEWRLSQPSIQPADLRVSQVSHLEALRQKAMKEQLESQEQQLVDRERCLEEERWKSRQELQRERVRLQVLKAEMQEESKSLEQQRLAIASEKARVATLARLHSDSAQEDVARMRAEVSAAQQEVCAERSWLRTEQAQLSGEKRRLEEWERDLESKARDLHEMAVLAKEARDHGRRALSEAARKEHAMMDRAVSMQHQLDLVAERERRCVEQKLCLSQERLKLRNQASDVWPTMSEAVADQPELDPQLVLLHMRARRLDVSRDQSQEIPQQLSFYSASK